MWWSAGQAWATADCPFASSLAGAYTRAPVNEQAAVERTVTTPDLLNAIGLLAIQFPEGFHLEAWRALTAETSKRELGVPAKAITLARRDYDHLPFEVKAALRGTKP